MTNRRKTAVDPQKIPPPPDPDEGYDAVVAYFEKYPTEELEAAGYLKDPSPEEVEELTASAVYSVLCRQGLHLKLSRKDYEQLAGLAARQDVSVEKLVKRWVKQHLADECKR